MTQLFAKARITTIANIRRVQRLPANSVPRVLGKQTVKATEILAVGELIGRHRVVDVAAALEVNPKRVENLLVKSEGNMIDEDELLATRKRFLKKRLRVKSPISGHIVRVENGQVLIEGERDRIEVEAALPGKILDIASGQHIVIETTGAQIQIAWGHGGLVWGTLKILDDDPSNAANTNRFNIEHRGAIIATALPLTEELIKEAADIHVKGIIGSSMSSTLVPLAEEMEFPIGLTQGFGNLPMSERVLNLLKTYNERDIALDMGMAFDWREKRPEIIIPLSEQKPAPIDERDKGLSAGQRVRILQSPYLGEIGTVVDVPDGPRQVASGFWLDGAVIEMASGDSVFIPVANLEQLG